MINFMVVLDMKEWGSNRWRWISKQNTFRKTFLLHCATCSYPFQSLYNALTRTVVGWELHSDNTERCLHMVGKGSKCNTNHVLSKWRADEMVFVRRQLGNHFYQCLEWMVLQPWESALGNGLAVLLDPVGETSMRVGAGRVRKGFCCGKFTE